MPASSAAAQTQPLPRLIFIEELAALIGKAPTTIRTYATCRRYLHLIPRPFKLPNSRRLCWREEDVIGWINSTTPASPPPVRRPRGRPTKRETLERQRWAMSKSEEGSAGVAS